MNWLKTIFGEVFCVDPTLMWGKLVGICCIFWARSRSNPAPNIDVRKVGGNMLYFLSQKPLQSSEMHACMLKIGEVERLELGSIAITFGLGHMFDLIIKLQFFFPLRLLRRELWISCQGRIQGLNSKPYDVSVMTAGVLRLASGFWRTVVWSMESPMEKKKGWNIWQPTLWRVSVAKNIWQPKLWRVFVAKQIWQPKLWRVFVAKHIWQPKLWRVFFSPLTIVTGFF